MDQQTKSLYSKIEECQKETKELVKLIKKQQEMNLQLSEQHFCDTMVDAQRNFLMLSPLEDPFLQPVGFIPNRGFEQARAFIQPSNSMV